MAHRRSFRGRGISESQRRKKSWIQVTGPPTDGVLVGSSQTPNLQFNIVTQVPATNPVGASIGFISDPVLDKVPPESTILRLRGSVNLPKNQFTGVEVQTFAIGIGVMESTAAALGAFPNPATPEGGAWDGWMFYRSQQQGALDSNAGIVDVKSMRKVQSGQSIIIVFGEAIATTDDTIPPFIGGAQSKAEMNLRALILLP